MGKWIYVYNKPRFFKDGAEFIQFFKERIDAYNKKKEAE